VQLTLQVARWLAEIGEAHRLPIHRVQIGETVHQLESQAEPRFHVGLEPRRQLRADYHARHAPHQVKRRAENGCVLAHEDWLWHRHISRCERADDAVLAANVMGGRQ
jgi:hypothetical protein